MKTIAVGSQVVTSYGTGPYEIIEIDGPCFGGWDCPCDDPAFDENEHRERTLPAHYHFVARYLSRDHNAGQKAFLHGYTLDGISVGKIDEDGNHRCCDDRLEVVEQGELFGPCSLR